MIDPTTLFVTVAILTLLIPIAFLLAVAYAAGRRRRRLAIGPRLAGLVAVLGGASIGIFLLTGADVPLVVLPILGAALLLVLQLWQRRRRIQAGQVIVGTALPWAITWTLYLVGAITNPSRFDLQAVALWFSVGVAAFLVGLVAIRRGDPPAPAAAPEAPAGEPGSRSYGSIAAAIREPGRIGPFGQPELATIVAFVLVWVVVPFLIPSEVPRVVGFVLSTVVGAFVGTDAYLRAMPTRSRRAFEAFSWLGEHELRAAGDSAADPIPTSPAQAGDWLARHAVDTPETRWLRVEVLTLAGRFDEARRVAASLPETTPAERWAKAEALDSVDWRAGGDGDLAALEAAAAGLLPADGDERLRAEVSIAAAKVRRRMADGRTTPGDALDPLVEVRARLGQRADGQLGRALRRRMFTTILVVGLLFGAALYVLGPLLGTSF